MNADAMELIRRASLLGITMRYEGKGAIRYKPAKRMPESLSAAVRAHKWAVAKALLHPAGMTYSAVAVLPLADRQDLIDLFDESHAYFETEVGHDRYVANWLAWAMVWAECDLRYDRARAIVKAKSPLRGRPRANEDLDGYLT